MPIRRREFLSLPALPALAADPRKPVALIITEYRENSHADVIATRLLGGYEYYGKWVAPRVRAVSMFTDQVPWNDMSRGMAQKHDVRLFNTVREALTLGGGKLAVEGVVLIGEHGTYPYNEKLQHLYPRYELFSQIVDVFRASGRSVPVFSDKHLSVDWWKAKKMVEWSKELKFPFLAGSSVPIAWRRPEMEVPFGATVKHAVAAAYGGNEAYGYHATESLQVLVERRKGGETGIAAVRMLEGPEVWKWTDANPGAGKLLAAALERSETRKPGDVRVNARRPAVFILEYKDGLQGAVYMLDGHIRDFNLAVEASGQTMSTLMWLQPGRFYSHFSTLVHYIEELILTGKPAYPVERTLLTTGAIAAVMESAWRGHERVATPHLEVRYTAPKQSLYNRGAVPKLEKEKSE